MFANLLRTLFNLYPGEGRPSFYFALVAFLWSVSVSCGLVLSDSLFVVHIGADALPQVYIQIAFIQFLIAYLTITALKKYRFNFLYKRILLLTSLCCFYFFLTFHYTHEIQSWHWYAIKIFCNTTFVILMTSYWNFIDQYYDLQDAKRHYGVFTAAIFLGMGIGGLLVTWFYPTLSTSGLLFVMGVFIILALIATNFASRKRKEILEDTFADESKATPNISYTQLLATIVRSPFTLLVMMINMVMYLLDMISEFTYFEFLETLFTPSPSLLNTPDQLTLFLGEVRAWTSLGCILFSTFFYSRLVKRFGINTLFPVTPILFTLVYLTWNLQAGISIAVITFISVEGVRDLIDTNSFNIHINVVPAKIKNIVRVAVNSFFEPIGILCSALLLMVSGIDSKLLGLLLSLGAFGIMLLLRKIYPKAVYQTLTNNTLHFHRPSKHWFDTLSSKEREANITYLFTLLETPTHPNYALAFEALLVLENRAYLPLLLDSASRAPESLRTSLTELLTSSLFKQDPYVLDTLKQWKIPFPPSPLPFSTFKELIPSLLQGDLQGAKALLHLPRSTLKNHTSSLIALLTYPHPSPFRLLILEALKGALSPEDIRPLIETTEHFRPIEKRELEKTLYPLRKQAIPLLLELTKDSTLHDQGRIIAGKALGHIDQKTLRNHLLEIFNIEVKRAYFYAYHALTIQQRYPHHPLSLLEEGLESNFHTVMDFIIHLLGVAGSLDDVELLLRSLRSRNHTLHSHAVEAIERACEPKIFRLLEPLVDDRPTTEKITLFKKQVEEESTLEHLLYTLETSTAAVNHIIADTLRKELYPSPKKAFLHTKKPPKPTPQLACELLT